MSGRLYASRRIGGVSMNGVAGLFFAVAIVAALPAMSETWTFQKATTFSGGPTGNYDASDAWKDENGVTQAFDENASTARTYLVPAGKTLISKHDEDNAWQFTPNNDTFILEGSSSSLAVLASSTKTLTIPLLVMKDNSQFVQAIQADKNQKLLGAIRVDASDSYPAQILGWGWQNRSAYISATITGAGSLVFSEHMTGGDVGTMGKLYLYDCDASGFTGPITMKMPDGATKRSPPNYFVNASKNLGGNPASFLQKGLVLAGVYLELQGDVALPANRGLYIGTHNSSESSIADYGARIGVAGSRTLTVTTPVAFEREGTILGLTNGSGVMAVPGWAANGGIRLASGMTLNITGASVAEGVVTPAAIGFLQRTNGSIKLTISGDGSQLAEGRYIVLTAASLPVGVDTALMITDDGAFTLPTGKKAMYSVEDGKRIVLTVKDDCPTWTFASTSTQFGNYALTDAWTDQNGTAQTLANDSTTVRDYIVPSGKYLSTENAKTVANWSFTSSEEDSFWLKSSSTIESGVLGLHIPYLHMGDGSTLSLSSVDYGSVSGRISVEASEESPAKFLCRLWQSRHQTNETTMVGSGALVYTHSDQYNENVLILKGDASGFTGPLAMKTIDVGEAHNTQQRRLGFAFTDGSNIAGNPAEFQVKGLDLEGARLFALDDASLGSNRGMYISRNFTNEYISPGAQILVKSGCTFSIPGGVAFEDADYPLTVASGNYTGMGNIGGGTLSLPGWAANGTVKVTTGTLEITGASVAEGVVTPATVGKLEMSGDAKVTVRVTGDGSELPLANATNVLLVAEGALPADFADKVRIVNDHAFTVPPSLKVSAIVLDDGKTLALETARRKGLVLIFK